MTKSALQRRLVTVGCMKNSSNHLHPTVYTIYPPYSCWLLVITFRLHWFHVWNADEWQKKNLNKWVEDHNGCICFHTGREGSPNGFMSIKMMWVICCSQSSTQPNTSAIFGVSTLHHYHQSPKWELLSLLEEWCLSLQKSYWYLEDLLSRSIETRGSQARY